MASRAFIDRIPDQNNQKKQGSLQWCGRAFRLTWNDSRRSELLYLLKAWSSCRTTEASLCKQAKASCGNVRPPSKGTICMVWGSKRSALNTSKLKCDRKKWPSGSAEWEKKGYIKITSNVFISCQELLLWKHLLWLLVAGLNLSVNIIFRWILTLIQSQNTFILTWSDKYGTRCSQKCPTLPGGRLEQMWAVCLPPHLHSWQHLQTSCRPPHTKAANEKKQHRFIYLSDNWSTLKT